MKKKWWLLLAILLVCGCAVLLVHILTGGEDKFPAEFSKKIDGIHVSEANWDRDIYMDSVDSTLDLYIYSEQKLDVDDITVDIPVEAEYGLYLMKENTGKAPASLSEDAEENVKFTYDVYLNYLGFDWTELANKYRKMQAQEEGSQAYLEAEEEYTAYYQQHWDNYLLLDESQIPQFYRYKLMITFQRQTEPTAEKFNSLTLKIGEQVLTMDIGEVRLQPKAHFSYGNMAFEYITTSMGTTKTLDVPTESFRYFDQLTACKDFRLTGYQFDWKDMKMGDIRLQIRSYGNEPKDFVWDGETPLELKEANEVDFDVMLTIPQMAKPGASVNTLVTFRCEVGDETLEHMYECTIEHVANCYEEYAKFYHGIDFTEYYEAYYYPCVMGIES